MPPFVLIILLNFCFTSATLDFLITKGAKIILHAINASKVYESFPVSKRVKRQFIAQAWNTLLPDSKVLFIEDIKKDTKLSRLMIKAFRKRLVYHAFTFGRTHTVFFVLDGSLHLAQIIPYAVIYPLNAIKFYRSGSWLSIPFWSKYQQTLPDPEGEEALSQLIRRGAVHKATFLAPIIEAALAEK